MTHAPGNDLSHRSSLVPKQRPLDLDEAPLLQVRSVSKYYGPRIGCEEISFDLWPGEVLAIVGESGSGKTTLLNCISTRLAPGSGSVGYRMRDGVLARRPWPWTRQKNAS